MPFLHAAVQRLGSSSVRRFGAVAGHSGNPIKELAEGLGLAGVIIGGTGAILSAYHKSMHTSEWVKP